MDDAEKVRAAIRSHTQWFVKLQVAINTGMTELDPEIVKIDNNCEFGKWLYGDFPQQQKSTDLFQDIKKLHAEFHQGASKCLNLAINNKKKEDIAIIEKSGELRGISIALIMKLHELQRTLIQL